MNPQKVRREQLHQLEDLPNIGKAMAADLRLICVKTPQHLRGREAFEMYQMLCARSGRRHDPCVIDVFMSVVSFMRGGAALPWWAFTAERKRRLHGSVRP